MNTKNCTYAPNNSFGHECGKPATVAASKQSKFTKNGVYFALRCDNCKNGKGRDNAGLSKFFTFDAAVHVNQF